MTEPPYRQCQYADMDFICGREDGHDGAHAESTERLTGQVAAALLRLDQRVVAEHPEGHRVVGTVRGHGPQGVILYVSQPPSFQVGFLSADSGWTFSVVDSDQEPR